MNDVIGRYAPSPSGDLHVGNLRTAVIAWLCAPRGFRLRIDDIDAQRSSTTAAQHQIEDLRALGLRFSGPVVRQQESLDLYAAALRRLEEAGLVYECYCSRKDIQEAARAPHAVPGRYPGTCRGLSAAERAARRAELEAAGRVPALRLAAGVSQWSVREKFAGGVGGVAGGPGGERGGPGGVFTGEVDDMVLRRGGNAGQVSSHDYAYNLAVVVDDATAGVTQVTRGDDLLSSAPRQAYVASLLGLPEVEYVHVPLVLGPTGQRLAKRDGAVTLRELVGRELAGRELAGRELAGRELAGPVSVLRWILSTVLPADKFANLRGSTAEELLDSAAEVFDLAELDPNPVTFPSE